MRERGCGVKGKARPSGGASQEAHPCIIRPILPGAHADSSYPHWQVSSLGEPVSPLISLWAGEYPCLIRAQARCGRYPATVQSDWGSSVTRTGGGGVERGGWWVLALGLQACLPFCSFPHCCPTSLPRPASLAGSQVLQKPFPSGAGAHQPVGSGWVSWGFHSHGGRG